MEGEDETWPNEFEEAQAQYEDESDVQDDRMEREEDASQANAEESYGYYPQAKQKDSIFTFFRHILGIKDSSKVGNLTERELGQLGLSVRGCQYLSLIGRTLHNQPFSQFFNSESQIALATSASRKGWLTELVVSQKKFAQRTVQAVRPVVQKKPFLGIIGKQNESAKPQQ